MRTTSGRGSTHFFNNSNFSQLYRKLASMQEKADSLYSQSQTGVMPGDGGKA